MTLPELNTHLFVIEVWLEETAEEAGRTMRCGHITHVPSGERRYLENLEEITAIITPYLQEMGTE